MGTFQTDCTISNIADRSRSLDVSGLLVDTGSEYTWVSESMLASVGIEREKKDLSFVMANGQEITRSTGFAIIRVDDWFTVDEVVFAEAGDLLLLGARSLEGMNLRVDSAHKKLVAAGPRPAASSHTSSATINKPSQAPKFFLDKKSLDVVIKKCGYDYASTLAFLKHDLVDGYQEIADQSLLEKQFLLVSLDNGEKHWIVHFLPLADKPLFAAVCEDPATGAKYRLVTPVSRIVSMSEMPESKLRVGPRPKIGFNPDNHTNKSSE